MRSMNRLWQVSTIIVQSLTAAALNLASRVILDLQIRAREIRAQKAENNKKAVARQKVMDAQTQLQYEIQR